MQLRELSWRDRILLVNGVLFCILGGALVIRWLMGQAAPVVGILGLVLLLFGAYRLVLAKREARKRAGSGRGR